jgi:tight adherence protein C
VSDWPATLAASIGTFAPGETAILLSVFLMAAAIGLVVALRVNPALEKRRRLRMLSGSTAHPASPVGGVPPARDFDREIDAFYDVFLAGDVHALKFRLVKAGYFGRNAFVVFNLVRFTAGTILFAVSLFLLQRLSGLTILQSVMIAAIFGGLGVIIPNFVLDSMARSRQDQYRRTFPDFIDMLVVCADAGLSIEAAAERVSREYLTRDRAFGIHLGVMMLEVRAGKRLREAISALADRTGLDDARALATLFRQSEELGVSLTKALRTHSREMRQKRMLRAEEKANVLPVKMLLPLGAFVFPVTLVIVLVPVLIKLFDVLKTMTPSA